jgi:hypothetical protein
LHKAVLPLFSLAQFVKEIENFHAMADRVASRPNRADLVTGGVMTHRDVVGICNDTKDLKQFNRIAAHPSRKQQI